MSEKTNALAILLGMVACAATACAAELPSRQGHPAPAPAKRCQIGGQPGFLSSDGQTCVRFSGYVSGQVAGGSLK